MIIERQIYKEIKKYLTSPEAIIITGLRRTGKTTLIKYIYEKVNSTNKIFLDLENPLNQRYFENDNFEQIKFTFETLGLNFNKKTYIFLDEIQLVRNIPNIVKYFIDHYNVKFFLTGSTSFYLKNLFSESLAGRKYIFELYPFNFQEFLLLKQAGIRLPSKHSKITSSIYQTLIRHYEEYMIYGGFPQVILKESVEEKKKVFEDIFSSYFQLEVKQLGDFRKISKIRDLIILLYSRVGTKLDINKLSQEINISRPTIYEYISFLEGTYFIKLVKPYSKNKDIEIRKTPKIYACDSGLLNYLVNLDKGRIFEQNIFQQLINKGEVNYYQKKSGQEIDFILDKKISFEVKLTPTQSDLNRLKRLSSAIDIKNYKIISYNFSNLDHIIYPFDI